MKQKQRQREERVSFLMIGATKLYKRMLLLFGTLPLEHQVEADLMKLYPSENREWMKQNYYVKKTRLSLLVLFVGIGMSLAAMVNERLHGVLSPEGIVTRMEPGEENQILNLYAKYENENFQMTLTVEPRELTKEEIKKQMNECKDSLGTWILGKNESLDWVEQDLNLASRYEGFLGTIEWESSQEDIIDVDGTIQKKETKQLVWLSAALFLGEEMETVDFEVTLAPRSVSEREEKFHRLEASVAQVQQDKTEGTFMLPTMIENSRVEWGEKKGKRALYLLLATVLISGLVYVFSDRDLHEKAETYKKGLKNEYFGMIHEFALLISTGMTIKSCFFRMAENYEKRKEKTGRKQAIYEEIHILCREMSAGTSEGAAYEQFGKRIGLQEYIRLMGLLTQNLKRGNQALPARLREEVNRSCEEKMQQCKKMGEEAGTKLLVPMVLLLLQVMLLIMVPALSGF